MLLGVIITAASGVVCGWIWNASYSSLDANFSSGVICFVLAAIVESMSEPLLCKFILAFDYSVGAKSEAIAVFSKTIFLFAFTKLELCGTLLNFGLAQLFYAFIMLFSAIHFG